MPGYYLEPYFGEFTYNCRACSAEAKCATCTDDSTLCTTCVDGYSIVGHKCLADNHLEYTLKLDLEPGAFYSKTNAFRSAILSSSGATTDARGVFLKSIKPGSTDVTGIINAADAAEVASMKTALAASIDSDPTLSGLSVLGVDLES